MLELRDFIQNQHDKIKDLLVDETPHDFFFYSNGVHLLLIKRSKKKYLLCGLNLPYKVLYSQNELDIYFESEKLMDVVKEFERFITLLLLPRRFEKKSKFVNEQDSLFVGA